MAEEQEKSADGAGDELEEFKKVLRDQRERQTRLRDIQQFLTSPLFLDLRDSSIKVSDPPEVIEDRKLDLDYRIRVLESLMVLLKEERALLDRTHSAQTPVDAPDGDAGALDQKATA